MYLVGAGPGAPGLLTLRGAEVLARAELVVCDGLVDPRMLRRVRPEAKVVWVGRRGVGRIVDQDEVNALLVESAREGKVVVRLKGGDPYVFGRGGEEGAALTAAGVRFEVVPGVSCFASVPGSAGIPLSVAGVAPVVSVLSGHEDPAKPTAQVDWVAAAAAPGMKVVLMGVERIRVVTERLLEGGLRPETPAAMVRWGTTAEQRTVVGSLGTIAELVEQGAFKSPAVLVLGDAVRWRENLDWFERRPLFGRRVVITRARVQAAELAARLEGLGAEVVELPMIRFGPPSAPAAAESAVARLGEYDWVVFTSAQGVEAFFGMLLAGDRDVLAMGQLRIAAVGESTAARLRGLRLRVDAVPSKFAGRQVAAAVAAKESLRDLRVLLARAEVGSAEVVEAFERAGAMVDDVAFYRTLPEEADPEGNEARLVEEGADWLTFTSGSTVEEFARRFDLPGLCVRHPRMRVACIGPETAKALAAVGVSRCTEAAIPTVEGMVTALVQAGAGDRKSPSR